MRKVRITVVLSFILVLGILALGSTEINIVWPGTSETEIDFAKELKAAIEKEFADLDVNMMYIGWPDLETKLITMVMAGNVPDLVFQQDYLTFVKMDAFEPLNMYLESQPLFGVTKDAFVKSFLDFSTYEGNIYTIPTVGIAYGLLVRSDLLEEAGYQPSDIKTWDDLIEVAKALTIDKDNDGKIDQYGLAYAAGAHRYAWRQAYVMGYSNGFSLDEVENKKSFIEVLELINELKPYMPTGFTTMDLKEAFQAYCMGKAAMMITGSFFTANVYPINPEVVIKTRAVAFPKGPSAEETAVPVANAGWAMFAESPHKDLNWKVLSFITSKEWGGRYSSFINLPARKDVSAEYVAKLASDRYPKANAAKGNENIIADFVEAASKHGKPMKTIQGRVEMEKVFVNYLSQMLQGKLTEEETYERVKEGIEQIKAGF